jgi:predicted dehydrogenase
MPPPYRAAVIGLGRMGSTFDDEIERGGTIFLPYCHAPSYHAAPGVELVAGADLHHEQRRIFGERWDITGEHLYEDYRDMLAAEQLDLVSICTTARLRSRIVQDVARAGVKGIWAEKPLSLTLAEADTMIEVCREHRVALAVNCARRWTPHFAEARRLIDSGELGDLLQITVYAECGLSHNGSHAIDTIRFLAGGRIEWVFGEIESDEVAQGEGDPRGNGYLAFDNGVRAYLRSTPCGAASWEIDIIGTEGRIRSLSGGMEVEYWKLCDGGPRNRRIAAKLPFPLPARIQGMGLSIISDLIDAAEEGRQPLCSGEDGRAALETALALRESHRRGGTKVHLPLEDRSLGIQSSEISQDGQPARVRRLQADATRS